jgi:hypothetical protein
MACGDAERRAAVSHAAATAQAFVAAWVARDLRTMMALTSPDVILKSPIMGGSFVLEGHGEVEQAYQILLDGFDDLVIEELFAGNDTQVLTFAGRAHGEPFDAVQSMRVDANGAIDRIVMYVRPFAGVSAFARVVGPRFMRPHNRLWAALASLYGWVTTSVIRHQVWLGGMLVKRSVRRIASRARQSS